MYADRALRFKLTHQKFGRIGSPDDLGIPKEIERKNAMAAREAARYLR